jgi:ubiquinone/menaquinone biosynthesis C-methylase UbiE
MKKPKKIIEDGYDRVADRYGAWAGRIRAEERARYASVLLDTVCEDDDVLELGCGDGLPTTRQLAERFSVTGVDLSSKLLSLARRNVPAGKFIHADMTELEFESESFDAVAAFYSLIHVPRNELPSLLISVEKWLRPGGLFVATMGTVSEEIGFEDDWLGVPMCWSSYDAETNSRLVEESGLHIISAQEETANEDGKLVTFLWVVAEKPGG